MNKLKYERYLSEQAFILSYVKDCLSNAEKLQEVKKDAPWYFQYALFIIMVAHCNIDRVIII